ncbi:hypothetical protein D3C85_1261330 [compost metagenome]
MTVHDEFFEKSKFPIKREKYRFVGERVDESEQVVGNDWEQIKAYFNEHDPSLFRRLKTWLRNIFK